MKILPALGKISWNFSRSALLHMKIRVYLKYFVNYCRFKYLVSFLSLRWITGGHTIQQPIERLLPSAGIELTPFHNSVSRVAGLQVYALQPIEPFPVSILKASEYPFKQNENMSIYIKVLLLTYF